MRKYLISLLTIALLITLISSVTYAWFTYVERKSLASFNAGVLSVSLFSDEVSVTENILFEDLAFIDYQNDLVDNTDNILNEMAASHRIDMTMDEESPLAKAFITITPPENQTGIIYLLVLEGVNIDESSYTTDYASIMSGIISGYLTKEEQLSAIDTYNDQVIADISNEVFGPDDILTFQIVCWGDYDALIDQENYLDSTFYLTLSLLIMNSKGELTP